MGLVDIMHCYTKIAIALWIDGVFRVSSFCVGEKNFDMPHFSLRA